MVMVREYLSEEVNFSPKLNNDELPHDDPGHPHFTGEKPEPRGKGYAMARVHRE